MFFHILNKGKKKKELHVILCSRITALSLPWIFDLGLVPPRKEFKYLTH